MAKQKIKEHVNKENTRMKVNLLTKEFKKIIHKENEKDFRST